MSLESKIRSLITLMGDDDFAVREMAKQKLIELDKPVCSILREVGASDAEGRIRIECQSLLEVMRLEKLANEFRNLNSNKDFNLEQACFILAEIEYPNLDVPFYTKKIDRLAQVVKKRTSENPRTRTIVECINHLLFSESEFRGNVHDYYDPENSYPNRVLDRHLGIPISLSVLYLFIARRVNASIYGVGFPGHFMLKFRDGSKWFFIDTFNKGKIRTREECKEFLISNGFPYHDSYAVAMRPRDILARMIRNLGLIYHENSQPGKVDILERIFSNFVMAE